MNRVRSASFLDEDTRSVCMEEYWDTMQTSFRRTVKKPHNTIKCTPLGHVIQSMETNENILHGPLMVYVVNFSAMYPHPHKFCYPVCNASMDHGKVCGESLELGAQCNHDSLATGNYSTSYQFEVLLSDAVHNGDSKPIWCRISAAAALLLGFEATEFRTWTDQQQLEYVRDLILRMPLCRVYVRVQNSKPTVVNIFTMSFPELPLSLPETARPSWLKEDSPSSSLSSSSGTTLSSSSSSDSEPTLIRTLYMMDKLGMGKENQQEIVGTARGPEGSVTIDIIGEEDDGSFVSPSQSVVETFSIEPSAEDRDNAIAPVRKLRMFLKKKVKNLIRILRKEV